MFRERARAWRENAGARPAAIQPDRFEFLGATAFRGDPPAVAGRAALGRLDRRSGLGGCWFGRAGHAESIARAVLAVTNPQGGRGTGGNGFARGRVATGWSQICKMRGGKSVRRQRVGRRGRAPPWLIWNDRSGRAQSTAQDGRLYPRPAGFALLNKTGQGG